MNNLPEKTKQLCNKYNIKPARSRGQNFLVDEDVYNKIIDIADLKKSDTVLEIGPGLGFLTRKLAEKAREVLAVEIDCGLVNLLNSELVDQGIGNVRIINANILDFKNEQFRELSSGAPELSSLASGYKIVANLPYNITSIFLRKFLTGENKPESMVLMLQKEVAERITAKSGKMSLLAVSVQYYSEPKLMLEVTNNAFWPEPEVDSAIVFIDSRKKIADSRGGGVDEKKFFRLVKIGFSARRKMLKNNLAGGLKISQKEAGEILIKAGYDEKIRAQALSVEDWIKLYSFFREIML